MITSCANPSCRIPFDYHYGELYRFPKAHRPDEQPPNTHSVQHFWLCGKCATAFSLSYSGTVGVFLQDRSESAPLRECKFVASA